MIEESTETLTGTEEIEVVIIGWVTRIEFTGIISCYLDLLPVDFYL